MYLDMYSSECFEVINVLSYMYITRAYNTEIYRTWVLAIPGLCFAWNSHFTASENTFFLLLKELKLISNIDNLYHVLSFQGAPVLRSHKLPQLLCMPPDELAKVPY